MKGCLIALVVLLGGGCLYWFVLRKDGSDAGNVRLRTAKVDRGLVIEGVAASGTVQPLTLVQVGTQISGVIEKLLVDFNSKVKAGQTIALLDARRLAAQVAQDEASVARAEAEVERAKALVTQARAEVESAEAALVQTSADIGRIEALLVQARADLERQKQLVERRLTAPADVDAAVAAEASLVAQLAAARAAVRKGEASISVARANLQQGESQAVVAAAAVKQEEARLESDRVNLGYATIISPVDGVVVSRNVDVGQTVAASLQAPTLFVIAEDLTQVEVQTSVPEADIGRLFEKQRASFTVDAHPERVFEGEVSQVRLASTTVSNVVTYTVIVGARNPDGLLFPGMTANVTFEVARSATDSLRVPVAALRVQPTADLLEPAARETPGDRAAPGKGAATVYATAPGGRLRPIAVRTGVSDAAFTAVEPAGGSALDVGTEIVTAILREEPSATTNPFAPRMPGRRRP